MRFPHRNIPGLLTLGFLLALLPGLSAGETLDDMDAMGWLQKMKLSMQSLSYRGRFVYQHGDKLESMSIVHRNEGQGVRERLYSLNGEAREILRDSQNLTCIWPSSKQVVVDRVNDNPMSPLWIPDDIKRLSKFYQFRMVGSDRVADRDAEIILIEPRDRLRYGMQVWLDRHSGLLLQSVVLNEENTVLERVMFTEIELLQDSDVTRFDFLPDIDESYSLVRTHEGDTVVVQEATRLDWNLDFVPGGFWLEKAYLKRMNKSAGLTTHMIYTDGMASVSVFIEPMSESQHLSGESSMGAVNAFSADLGKHTVTAIGEVPALTVRQMAASAVYSE